MASGKTSKAARRNANVAVLTKRNTPWGAIVAVAIIVALIAAFATYYVSVTNSKRDLADSLAAFTPTAQNQDPSKAIPGITALDPVADKAKLQGGIHVSATTQVAYTHSPPFYGAHDQAWAACNGVVYPNPVRSENLVHSLEHGAVWITYDAGKVSGAALDTLSAKVTNQPYTVMSPFPNLDHAVSLQSWGHQLKLDDVNDPRIDQFITALRHNQYTYPEVGASCQETPGYFSQDAPPPYAAPPAPGTPGAQAEVSDNTQVVPDAPGAAAPTSAPAGP